MAEAKDNNDPYTGTENQHDFAVSAGIKWEVLMNDNSKAYRDYVDSKFTWNQKITDRGQTTKRNGDVGIDQGQYKMTSGSNNNLFPGGNNSANSPYNQDNEPLWAYNDDGILIRTIGISKKDLQNGEGFTEDTRVFPTSSTSSKVNDWGKSSRNITVQSSKVGNRYNYKIIKVRQGNKQNIYKGRILAEEALEIPNNSLVVVDTDQTIGSHFKQNQGYYKDNGRAIPNKPDNEDDVDFVLWWIINPITAADSAKKASLGNNKTFNNFSGITVKALVGYSDVEIRGDNNNCKLNFKVKTFSMAENINQSGQIWKPMPGKFLRNDFPRLTMRVDNCKLYNNKTECSKVSKKLVKKNDGPHYMKSPPDGRNIAEMQNYNNMIWHLSRKRSGDLFQGELTRDIINLMGNAPLREYCFKKDPRNGNLIYPDMDAARGRLEFCENWTLNQGDAPWNQNGGPYIMHSTGDYPHLSWCLEHGLNVLFKPPRTDNFFHFKRL